MTEPLVAAIMLTRDRPLMAARAVASFRAQTYNPNNLRLRIVDTGSKSLYSANSLFVSSFPGVVYQQAGHGPSIGLLRNEANRGASMAEIIVHWDDDDYSHPNRIAEQVALLQSSGADAVGYRDMLFWRTLVNDKSGYGEAWLFTHPRPSYMLGTSFCYWRRVWEKRPFPDAPKAPGGAGEDSLWSLPLKVANASSIHADGDPRMVASIHGANSQPYAIKEGPQWKRCPEWDSALGAKMAL